MPSPIFLQRILQACVLWLAFWPLSPAPGEVQLLAAPGLAPPDLSTLATRTGLPLDVVNRIATLLVRRSVLIRAGDLVFHESALSRLKSEIQALKQSAPSATIDVGMFKERYHVTRKYAIPLLEYLDRERVTRRVGDTRKIL